MRQITAKYDGACKKCGADLKVGTPAMYEKYTGIFCVGCEPTDPEEIRAYRQERADRKADKYEEWAAKRRAVAEPITKKIRDIFHEDIALCTQPGPIPYRTKLIRQEDRAMESLAVAREMEEKADNLRNSVRVKGDAARKHQEDRDRIRPLLKVGELAHSWIYGILKVKKVNKKTVLLEGRFGDVLTDIHLIDDKFFNKATKRD